MRLLAGTGSNLRAATERSVTLLRVFLLASAVIIAAGGILLSSALTHAISDQALADSRASVSQYVDGVLRGELVRGGQVQVTRNASARLQDELRHNRSLVTVKVWRPDGVLAWTNRGQDRIGQRFEIDGDLGEAIESRAAVGHIDQLSSDEDAVEESSLEAIESLNATVEAKDPDTAGHSLRVQRVALAIAAQLDLTAQQLDALRFGSLFHDIGKIAVPDGILVKPAKLDYWEYAQMKTHSAEGARIVGKFGRLRDAVPIIRHHHERWDGTGYPEGLAGEQIPLGARIVFVADAYDAMTAARGHGEPRSEEEALAELERCAGTQFDPRVVEAAIRVVGREAAPEPQALLAARAAVAAAAA